MRQGSSRWKVRRRPSSLLIRLVPAGKGSPFKLSFCIWLVLLCMSLIWPTVSSSPEHAGASTMSSTPDPYKVTGTPIHSSFKSYSAPSTSRSSAPSRAHEYFSQGQKALEDAAFSDDADLERHRIPDPEFTAAGQNSGVSPEASDDKQELDRFNANESSTTPKNRPTGEQGEKLLLHALMNGYESDVRPVRNASHPVLIQVGITLTQIFDMDEKNQVLTTNVWLDQEWNDELLRWDPDDFGGLQAIRLPCRLIWLPDVLLYNSADDYERGYMQSRAMVSHDGNVFWPPPTKFRSTCPVDVTYFPFDDQVCTLKLGSWTYNGYQVDITNRSAEVDLTNYVQNGEWELLEARLQRNVVYYTCCPEPFPDVTVTLVIRRKTLYYIYNIVLPCMMLSILTLLVFCLPPDSGEKVALGITVLLAFSVFMLAIAEKMPETSTSIPLIGIYLTAVMAITSISVIVTVVVLNLHYLGPRVQPIPPWLRAFLPKDDIDFLREKSLLLPYTAKSGVGRRTQQVYLISQHRPNQHGPVSYSTSVPPTPTVNASSKNGNSTTVTPRRTSYDILDQSKTPPMANHNKYVTKTQTGLRKRVNSQEFVAPIDEEIGMGIDLDGLSSTDSLDDGEKEAGKPPERTATNAHERSGLLYPAQRYRHISSNSPHQVRPAHAAHLKAKGLSPHKRVYRLNNFAAAKHHANSSKSSPSTPASATRVQEELLKSIQHLLAKQEELEFQNILVAEWRMVAQVIDRILFWIFFLITLASSGVFLLILPLYKRTWNGPS